MNICLVDNWRKNGIDRFYFNDDADYNDYVKRYVGFFFGVANYLKWSFNKARKNYMDRWMGFLLIINYNL